MHPSIVSVPNATDTFKMGEPSLGEYWTVTDSCTINPTYVVLVNNTLNGSAGSWVSGVGFYAPEIDGVKWGVGTFNITLIANDGGGNQSQKTIILTITAAAEEAPFGDFFVLFACLAVIGIIVVLKKKQRVSFQI